MMVDSVWDDRPGAQRSNACGARKIGAKSACKVRFVKLRRLVSELETVEVPAVDYGDDQDVVLPLLIPDHMAAMLVSAYSRPETWRGPSHARMVGEHGKALVQAQLVAFGLPESELFEAIQVDIQQFAIRPSG